MRHEDSTLPLEVADRFTRPLAQFLKIEVAAAVLLLVATGAALLLSNSPWSAQLPRLWETSVGLSFGPFDFSRSLQRWLNEGVMTLFFFVIALELKRQLVQGELRGGRRVGLSLAGALGGMLVPVGLYLVLVGNDGGEGWGVAMSTDTAFVVACLALLGSRTPPALRLFLLSLAIFDDVGAIVVVAVAYGDAIEWSALASAAFLLLVVFGAARVGIRSMPVYVLLGVAVWLAVDASGVHPTVTGVVLGLMTPARGWVSDQRMRASFGRVLAHPNGPFWSGDSAERDHLRQAGRAARETLSPLEQLEILLHPWVAFLIMPAFALANAGVSLSRVTIVGPVSVAICASLVVGKPIGVLLFSGLAVCLGLATRPTELRWSLLAAGSLLTGIGFTMSLFIAGLAFSAPELASAKGGILSGALVSAIVGVSVLAWLTRARRTS